MHAGTHTRTTLLFKLRKIAGNSRVLGRPWGQYPVPRSTPGGDEDAGCLEDWNPDPEHWVLLAGAGRPESKRGPDC